MDRETRSGVVNINPMAHTIEPASSGRAKCRGCGNAIPKGELRFGERLPNPFSEGKEMTLWFHLRCAALKRPDVFGETLAAFVAEDGVQDIDADERQLLGDLVDGGLEHRRLPRITGVGRAPSARARCRHCRDTIPKGEWRIQLVYYDEGQFNPSGYIHYACREDYLGTADVVDRLLHFTPDLAPDDVSELRGA